MSVDIEFSPPENASNFAWSPDGVFLARTVNAGLVLQNVQEDTLLRSATLPSRIDALEWSGDSSFIACGALRAGIVQVFSVDQPMWNCRINVGNEEDGVGLEDFTWGSDARSILTTAAHYVQLTVWSISDLEVIHIKDILPVKRNKSFSESGKLMAIAQFNDSYETCIGIYSVESWGLRNRFPVMCKDLEEVCWCPNDLSILVRDSSLFCGVYIYSPSGDLLKQFSPDGLALGMTVSLWAPTGQFLATFSHRNELRILNGLTYGLLVEEKLEPSLPKSYPQCHQFSEVIKDGLGIPLRSCYDRVRDILLIPTSFNKSLKQRSIVKFSWDGKFLGVNTDSYPTTVWIWDMTRVELTSVLVHINDVSDFDWHFSETKLCICTGKDTVHFWSPAVREVRTIQSPAGSSLFRCKGVKWNPRGNSIALTSKDDKLILAQLSKYSPSNSNSSTI